MLIVLVLKIFQKGLENSQVINTLFLQISSEYKDMIQ